MCVAGAVIVPLIWSLGLRNKISCWGRGLVQVGIVSFVVVLFFQGLPCFKIISDFLVYRL